MTDKVPTKFTSTVLKYGWFFVHRYIHITYVQSYYMMVNKDIVCLQKIQEEKNEIDQIYGFFFNFLKLFLIVFNFSTEKSVILSWYRLQPNSSKLNSWNAEIFWGVFFAKKSTHFFCCSLQKNQTTKKYDQHKSYISSKCRL